MRFERLAPSFYYFLSGIFVAGAVNLLTGIASNGSRVLAGVVVLCAVGWLLCAGLVAQIGGLLEEARGESALLETANLTVGERAAIRRSTLAKAAGCVAWRLSALGALLAATALLLWKGAA